MAMKASQGVTTVVCGNCGASAAPYVRSDIGHFLVADREEAGEHLQDLRRVRGQGRRRQARHQRRLPDRPFDAAHERHGRRSRPPGDGRRDHRACATCSTRACEQGAIGMSSGLFYPPAMAASTDEVAEVAKPLGKWGGVYTAHMRDESEDILKSMDETFEIGRRAGASIVVSHHKCSGRTNFGRMKETLPKFSEAMKQQEIAFDVYPYIAGSTILRSDMLDRADKVLITWSDKVPGVSGRDLKEIAQEMGCSMREARRPPAAGRRHLLHDGREGRAERHGPSRRHDRLGRHPLRRPSASAPVGHVPARARALFARPETLPAGGRGAPHDVLLGAALRARQARRGQAGLLCRHLRVRSGDGDRHGDLREADLARQGHRRWCCATAQIVWRDGKPGGGRAGRALRRQDLQAEAKASCSERRRQRRPAGRQPRSECACADQSAPSSRRVRSRRSWRSCASTDSVAIGRASRRFSEIGSPVSSQ